jgi:putative methylase
MMQKNKLSILLSKLNTFEKPSLELEQYATPGSIAADIIWNAFMNKDIEHKIIADFACGPGVLGIACLALGAKKVYFVDLSKEALDTAKLNVEYAEKELGTKFDAEFLLSDIADINVKADTVIQNPPFGTKKEHADRTFLVKAFETADVVYSFHKTSTKLFVEAVAKDSRFGITNIYPYDFPIKHAHKFHTKPVVLIQTACWRLQRIS